MLHIERFQVNMLQENCYVLYMEDREDALLIDPGDDPDKIKAALGGRQVAAILLTHGHWDHTGAIYAFEGVPIYMHQADAHMLGVTRFTAGSFVRDIHPRPEPTDFVTDGQILKLAGITLQVLHTPGHAEHHVCLLLEASGLLFTGDHLMSGSTVVILPPDGSMRLYIESLRRLREMPIADLAPGHGSLIPRAIAEIDRVMADYFYARDALEAVSREDTPDSGSSDFRAQDALPPERRSTRANPSRRRSRS